MPLRCRAVTTTLLFHVVAHASPAERSGPRGIEAIPDLDENPDIGRPFLLSEFPNAKCLDGSPALFYYRAGSGDGAHSWLLFHEGAGFCTDYEDCLERSKGIYGSSKHECDDVNPDNRPCSFNITDATSLFNQDPKNH